MAKVGNKKTYVVHFKCGGKQHGSAPWTWEDWLTDRGVQYLRATGFILLVRDQRGDIKGEFDMSPDGIFTLRATKQEVQHT